MINDERQKKTSKLLKIITPTTDRQRHCDATVVLGRTSRFPHILRRSAAVIEKVQGNAEPKFATTKFAQVGKNNRIKAENNIRHCGEFETFTAHTANSARQKRQSVS